MKNVAQADKEILGPSRMESLPSAPRHPTDSRGAIGSMTARTDTHTRTRLVLFSSTITILYIIHHYVDTYLYIPSWLVNISNLKIFSVFLTTSMSFWTLDFEGDEREFPRGGSRRTDGDRKARWQERQKETDLPFSLTDSLSTSTSSQLVHSDVERSSSSEDD